MSNDESRSELPLQVALARRVNLLLDSAAEQRGSAVTFREIQEFLAARGTSLSRARWFYMKDGTGPVVKDPKVLTAVCEYFDVDPSYLLDLASEELPSEIQAKLSFVKALRAARVQSFAARTLGDVSPETLEAITEFLNKDIDAHRASTSAPGQSSIEGGPPRAR